MATSRQKMQGSCLCGAVQFSLEPPTLWCAHCHCRMCQRAHGAAFVTWVGAAEDRVVIDDSRLMWYHSSDQAERGFCTICGSSLFFRSTRWPGEIHVTRANINGEIDREPEGHAFFDSHVSWFQVADSLPKSQPQ